MTINCNLTVKYINFPNSLQLLIYAKGQKRIRKKYYWPLCHYYRYPNWKKIRLNKLVNRVQVLEKNLKIKKRDNTITFIITVFEKY